MGADSADGSLLKGVHPKGRVGGIIGWAYIDVRSSECDREEGPVEISITVNGERHAVTTHPMRSLLDVLRENLGLTGTKYGCGDGKCGACTVLMEGKSALACSVTAAEADGKTIVTIEGLAGEGGLHPVQEAFLEEEAIQCGYCTPGMIMATVGLLETNPDPTDQEILDAMNGNLCRCCGYVKIGKAVRRAQKHMAEGRAS